MPAILSCTFDNLLVGGVNPEAHAICSKSRGSQFKMGSNMEEVLPDSPSAIHRQGPLRLHRDLRRHFNRCGSHRLLLPGPQTSRQGTVSTFHSFTSFWNVRPWYNWNSSPVKWQFDTWKPNHTIYKWLFRVRGLNKALKDGPRIITLILMQFET